MTLAVLDVLGRRVATLVSAKQPAGEHEVSWNGMGRGGSPSRPGVYLVVLRTPDGMRHTRVVRLK